MNEEPKHHNIFIYILIFIWFFVSLYASGIGERFALLMIPPFAIFFGILVGRSIEKFKKILDKFNIPDSLTISRILIIFMAIYYLY